MYLASQWTVETDNYGGYQAIRCYEARTSKMLVQWSSVVSEAPGILNSITDSEIGVHLGSSQFRISFA